METTKKTIYNHFNKGLFKNTHFTILTFQKGLSQHLNPINKGINNHVSVMLAFNHITCKIERFLVNYGMPTEIKFNFADLGDSTKLDVNHYRVDEVFPYKTKEVEEKYGLNSNHDGKFNKKFFQLFLMHLIFEKIASR